MNYEVNKSESTIILEAMANFLAGGSTILESIEYTRDMFDGDHAGKPVNPYFMSKDAKLYRVLQKVILDIREASISAEEALATYKVLTDDEKFVLQNPTEKPVILLKKILLERKTEGRFEAIIKKAFRTTFFLSYLVSGAMIFYRETIVDSIKQTQETFAVKADLSPDAVNIIPFYLSNEYFFIVVLAFSLMLYYGTGFLFKYFYENDRRIIYKFLNIKAWDDIPPMLQLMYSIKKSSSVTTVKIFEILEDKKSYNGLRMMFQRLQEHESIREPKFTLFEEYHFPKEMSLLVRARENTSSGRNTDFWYEFENFIEFSKSTAKSKFDDMEAKMQIIPIALPYIYPMWLMTDLGMVYSNMMNMSGINM